jgi:adenine deaminase
MVLYGNLIDIHNRKIYSARIEIAEGLITRISKTDKETKGYIMPGFVDAHVHIESSMVTPVAFSREAVRHGTIGIVSDPHEIANVLGEEGVDFMVENGKHTPLKILFGAPSCVPATPFESSGACIDAEGVERMLQKPEIGYLSEMMNYPGVVHNDAQVMRKLEAAHRRGVPVDGHAPGITGEELEKYAGAGITTDHECFTYEEAVEKIGQGMHILIREGSGAKNYNALIPLLKEYPDRVMFCTDDLHPDDLVQGHINLVVKKAISEGHDLFDTLRAASLNAQEHYQLKTGLLRVGDPADFIVVDSPENMQVQATYINGAPVFEDGKIHIPEFSTAPVNKFLAGEISETLIQVQAEGAQMKVIQAIDGELITRQKVVAPLVKNGHVISDTANDVLKIVVVNRYDPAPPAMGVINGFGLKQGALVSSIAHDSHNIICVGTSDRYITETINWVIRNKGGIAVHDGDQVHGLPLEIAGIMSSGSVAYAAGKYKGLSEIASSLGTPLKAPFMTLAFMALLVIPELKMSDKGLFDGRSFSFTPLFVPRNE